MMRIHLIPNSHIDPVWLWDKYEGIDEVLNTFRSACDRLDEYPNLTFSASSIQFYEWVLQHDATLFKRIQHKVADGRWEVTGGWWVEADTNLPTETSFDKHAELSRVFVREHFGKDIVVAYLPDSFGHPATLPKILATTGFKYFIFCRPDLREKPDLPGNLFYWEYEGYRVLAYRLKHHYLQYGIKAPETVDAERLLRLLRDEEYSTNPVNCYFFGVGNHGGGPAIAEIEFYNQFIAQQPARDVNYSTCLRFFEEASQIPNIPVYRGDLHSHAVGCYSVNRAVKQAMRHCEQHLQFTTRALEMAGKTDNVLKPLWEKTLFNQFHDILPGSCSRAAAEHAKNELGGVIGECEDTAYTVLKSMSRAVPVNNKKGEFRVFNTLPFPVTVPLELESFVHFEEGAVFRDKTDKEIQIQEVLPSVRCVNRRWEFVDTLPARGFKSYSFDNPTGTMQPNHVDIHFQPGTSIVTDLTEITSERTICLKNASQMSPPLVIPPIGLRVLADDSDTWGHGVYSYQNVVGSFGLESSAIITGPVTSKLYEHWTYHHSTIAMIYSVYERFPGVYIEIAVNWREQRQILKMELQTIENRATSFLMQGPGGAVERQAHGLELPLYHWVWLPTNVGNLVIIQDGAFACDYQQECLRLTLVRSSLYGYDQHTQLGPADPQCHTDQGEHRFRLCLFTAQDFNGELFDQMAQAFVEPYLVIREG